MVNGMKKRIVCASLFAAFYFFPFITFVLLLPSVSQIIVWIVKMAVDVDAFHL